MRIILALGVISLLGGCAELGFIAKPAEATPVAEAKPEPPQANHGGKATAQKTAPKACEPAAVGKVASIQKVSGGKTPAEAVEAAYAENSTRLNRAYATHRACYCWMVGEGLVNFDKAKAERDCKGVKLPS